MQCLICQCELKDGSTVFGFFLIKNKGYCCVFSVILKGSKQKFDTF